MNITATLLAEMVVFVSFIELTRRYIWPPLIDNIIKRQEEIAQGVEDAKQGKSLLEDAEAECKKLLQEAKDKHKHIVSQAQEASEEILSDAREQAKKVQADQVALAQVEIDKQTTLAKEGLEDALLLNVRQVLEKVMVSLPDQQQLEAMVTQASGEVRDETE